MKKTMIALVATIMAGACVFFACSKEENSSESRIDHEKHPFENSLIVETKCCDTYDYYKLLDADSNSWQWKRHDGDKFIFDMDVYWSLCDFKSIHVNGDNSFYVEYTNGDIVQVHDVVSEGTKTTSSIIADNDSSMFVTFTFPCEIDFMKAIKKVSDNVVEKDAAIPWAIVYGGVILAVTIYEGVNSYICERDMAAAAEKCEAHGCRPTKGNCSVKCTRTQKTPSDVDCSDYHYFG